MQILLGITKSNFGGAQRYVFDMATNLASLEHKVSVVCGGDGVLVQKLKEAGIEVYILPSLDRDINLVSDLKAFRDLFLLLKKERPEVFHINSSKMGGVGVLTGRLVGINKIIFTAHGFAWNERRSELSKKIIKFLSWLTIFFSHKTICVSDKLKTDASNFPFIKNNLVVIKNGIGEFKTQDQDEARKKLSIEIPENAKLAGTLSELHYTKGLDIALRALNKTNENIHFAIFGTGELRVDLRELVKMLGLQNRVHFLGFIENAKESLKALDIFTLTSRTEGLPYALLEAGIAGLPVIATNVGGIPELIKNGDTGILIESENVKSLTEALSKLSSNKKIRDKLASNLNKLVKSKFSIEKMVEETIKLYQ